MSGIPVDAQGTGHRLHGWAVGVGLPAGHPSPSRLPERADRRHRGETREQFVGGGMCLYMNMRAVGRTLWLGSLQLPTRLPTPTCRHIPASASVVGLTP